jgi:hypothetical protein
MDKAQKNDEKSALADINEFKQGKHFHGALSWFICIALTIFCYIETKITAMIILTPFLFLLGIGFLRESQKTVIKFDNGKMLVDDYTSFTHKTTEINVKDINTLKLDITSEGKTDIIHSITVVTQELSTLLPDVDNKDALKEKLLKINPSVKIKSV